MTTQKVLTIILLFITISVLEGLETEVQVTFNAIGLNAGNHSSNIEINFFIDQQTIQNAELIIETFDVDQAGGFRLPFNEQNKVSVNSHLIGILTGNATTNSFTTFFIEVEKLIPGPDHKNLNQIIASVQRKFWCLKVITAEMVIKTLIIY